MTITRDAGNAALRAVNALPVLAALAILGLFLAINLRVPLFADDYCLTLPVASLSAVIESTWGRYLYWSGRFPAIFLDYAVFSSGRAGVRMLALAGTAALAALLASAVSLTDRPRSPLQRLSVLAVFLYLFWFTPHRFGEIVFWKTGAIHYFLAVACGVVCLAPAARLLVRAEPVRMRAAVLPLYLAACFLGGAWLENQSVAIAVVWLALLWWARRRHVTVPAWTTAGWVMWLSGALALIIAPGNFARAMVVGSGPTLYERMDFILEWIPRLLDGRLLLLFGLFVSISALQRTEALRARLIQALSFAVTGLLAAFALVAVPVNVIHGRPSFPLEVFFIFATISVFPSEIFARTDPAARVPRRLVVALATALATFLLRDMLETRQIYQGVWAQEMGREELVRRALAAGETDIALPALRYGPGLSTYRTDINRGRLFARDFSPDKHHWTNACYARAHGLQSVAQIR